MTSVLNEPVLVLTKGWTPDGAWTVRDSFEKVMSNRARFLDPTTSMTHGIESWLDLPITPGHPAVRTTGARSVKVPEIVICTEHNKFGRKKVKYCRRNLWKRDGLYCQYCGRKLTSGQVTIDHVVPRCQGGKGTFDNSVVACLACNLKKAGKTPEQAHMRLRRTWIDQDGKVQVTFYNRPEAPKWSPFYAVPKLTRFPESWKDFVDFRNDELYWNVSLEP